MEASPLLVLAFACAASVPRLEAQTIVPPRSVRRGDPGIVYLLPDRGGSALYGCSMSIVFADGGRSPSHVGFSVPPDSAVRPWTPASFAAPNSAAGQGALAFVFAVPADAAPGEARMRVANQFGRTVAEAGFVVEDRIFPREDLWLDTALSSLRIDPDPRKTEQAVRYRALLARADPAAASPVSVFVRPVDTGRRTSAFGTRRRYLYADGGVDVSTHLGVDYGCPAGTPVMAALGGRVVMAEYRIVTGYTVVIEHFPAVYTIYMHLAAMDVAPGSRVGRGEPIGTVGATGLATGPHLHWELRVAGVACDPEALVGIDKGPPIRTMFPAIEGR